MMDFIRTNLKKIVSSRLLFSSTIISIVTAAEGAINFLYTMFIGRMLGQDMFGKYFPLIALLLIVTIPGQALQMIFSADISALIHNRKRRELRDYLKKVFIIIFSLIIFVAFALGLALPALRVYMDIMDDRPFFILLMMAALNLFAVPFQSLIQSREDYTKYIIYRLTAVISKFVFGVGFVYLSLSYLGALGGFMLSLFIGAAFLSTDFYFYIKRIKAMTDEDKNTAPKFISLGKILRSFFTGFLSVAAFQLIINMDSILVRHYLEKWTGIYSMAKQFGWASFFIANSISFVMLPFMSKDRENLARSNLKGFLFLSLILVSFCAFLALISRFLSDVIFAGRFQGMENILPLYSFMFLPYALISFVINYYIISQKLFYSIAIFAGVLLQYLGIVLFHKNLLDVCIVIGSVGYTVLAILMLDSLLLHKRKKVFNLV